MTKLATIILAAGKGTRMKSDLPKVLHTINNKPLVHYVIEQAKGLDSEKIVLIVGYKGESVVESTESLGVDYAWQLEQLGTGHAVMMAEENLRSFDGNILILCGDVPLLSVKTLKELERNHELSKNAVTVLTTKLENPFGYGRIIKDANSSIKKIVEQKDGSEEELSVNEINSGVYIVDKNMLFSALSEVKAENMQKEYYLTDIIEILIKRGLNAGTFCTLDSMEIMGINTIEQLNEAKVELTRR
ncbi:MAG: NTP transferase domain-containing protein [Candidatus Delongbacteria bacterium]|nr:NTP transferase domain-containing protein [Candidatus Delongbacteria bacterium]MBN2836193.1 NTP transferase domain-containing protein [Candidatus Delongbacteria bacterium]